MYLIQIQLLRVSKNLLMKSRMDNVNKIKVYYAKVPNMGDLLNRDIIENLFGYKVIRRNYLFGELSGIGSGLGNYTLEGPMWKKALKSISKILSKNVYIWGTGFVSYKEKDESLYKNTLFCAVRGELSKNRIEKLIGKKIKITLGDAGILASCLIENEKIEKKYSVGIIAHYKEKDEEIFKRLCERFPNSTFIDVQDTPINVTRKIAECETIISSSLHGLIIADSLNIPNIHIVVTNKLLGDGFKFDDYYSAYGIKHEYIDMNIDDIVSLDYVKNNYKLTKEMIDNKKREMINSFPYKKRC